MKSCAFLPLLSKEDYAILVLSLSKRKQEKCKSEKTEFHFCLVSLDYFDEKEK